MKKLFLLLAFLGSVVSTSLQAKSTEPYAVMVSSSVKNAPAWMNVANKLVKEHAAKLVYFDKSPREALNELKKIYPRYVAIVDMPQNINREYIMDLHKLSREIDDDIFADFLWGVITGYNAEAALRMIDESKTPLTIKNAVSTITELNSARWFNRYAWVDDHSRGLWGEKTAPDAPVKTGRIAPNQVLDKFVENYVNYTPDLVVTAAHATERNLEMPFSLGNLVPKNGRLMVRHNDGGALTELPETGTRKVYFAVGNCLIGNMNGTPESMAAAWMNSANAATMVGYVITTWHGRAGWGALKYWVTNPWRYTLAEACYLNQQDFLYQQNQMHPELLHEDYPYDKEYLAEKIIREKTQREIQPDQVGFWHDRDVLAYYGDPMWQVRLQDVADRHDYDVKVTTQGKKCVVEVTTHANFNPEYMKGDNFKQEHVLDLPFSCFFPTRLKNPRMAEGQKLNAVIDENFLLIYDFTFKPSQTYRFEIVCD